MFLKAVKALQSDVLKSKPAESDYYFIARRVDVPQDNKIAAM